MRIWLLLLICLCVAGCSPPAEPPKIKIDNIERILMNNSAGSRARWTLIYRDNGQLKVWSHEYCIQTELVDDVTDDEPCWAEFRKAKGSWDSSIEIHLHDIKQVEGGGWNHGKFGSGKTSVIQ